MIAVRALNIADLREAARRRLPRALFEYVDRGAEDEVALAANRAAIERLKLRPRVLRGVAVRSTETLLFGRRMALPIVVAPTAVAGLLWHDGDVLSARAAAAAGIPYTLSTYSLTSLETVARRVPQARLWFQLYVSTDRDHMRSLVRRAHAAGYESLVLTVDGAVAPNREYNTRNGFSIPIRPSARLVTDMLMHPRWFLGVIARHQLTTGIPAIAHLPPGGAKAHPPDAAIDWDTVRALRDLFPGRLILKGILHPEDAASAQRCGVDAVVVSNHGGRSLDGAIATLDALPDVLQAAQGRLPVLVDSGFQRGSDVIKALALGASAVMVGRPLLWGVACAGEAGAGRAIAILAQETDRVMAQVGCRSVAELEPSVLWRAPT